MTKTPVPASTTPDRLITSPVFILSSIRSGSTLLRCILDTHSLIHAPHELHLADLEVPLTSVYVRLAMEACNLDQREIEHLLWDRILHRELTASGKQIIVDKTPGNVKLWRRLAECWPQAHFVFLLRHPMQILASAITNRPDKDLDDSIFVVTTYLRELAAARAEVDGLTVRYEELTADPAHIAQGVCSFLGVPYEPTMLDYGVQDHGPLVWGIGDFTENIKTGAIQPARPLPAGSVVPDYLLEACHALGYTP
jgi:hypothetical protein